MKPILSQSRYKKSSSFQTSFLQELELTDRYLNWIINKVKLNIKSPVIELGSGHGSLSKLLTSHGFKVIASDKNLNRIGLMEKIGIRTKTMLSSELQVEGEKNEKIVGICKKVKADVLYDAQGAQEILDQAYFQQNNVKLAFQKYQHPVYRQQGKFIPYLSALDLLFNEGKGSVDIINSSKSLLT